ncbi:putative threonine aspartase isoform X1 [Senna tora]|uniref:Putative threonine aspartase isoform X1 n=1 Tax=Senna tora TaxID=362788 RepID=A0A835CMN1_9FABA|nr:putative threonine aspartase isoform X1 [Senna tora]
MAGEVEAESSRRFFVAVHIGAGYHSPNNEKALRSAMNRACLTAASVLTKPLRVSSLQNNLSPPPPCHHCRAPIQCDSDKSSSTFARLRTDSVWDKVLEWKRKAEEATKPGGSSYQNMERVVEAVLSMKPAA